MTSVAQGMARLRFGMLGRERVFGVLPLFHSFAQFACVWAPIFAGCATIIVPKIDRRRIIEALKHKPTIFLGVPALYGLLCLMKTAPLDGVKYFVSGGDALPDKIRSYFALLYGRKICSGYGLTETSPLISIDLDDVTAPTSTVGKPVLGIECAIKDEQGNDVQPDQVGELWVRGDNIMLGYYNAPEATQKVMLTHANVIRAAVIGRKDEQLGEIPIAYVQLRKEGDTIARELKQLCKNNLAAYKTPREFHTTTKNLPTTATGKVNKKALKAEYEPQQN